MLNTAAPYKYRAIVKIKATLATKRNLEGQYAICTGAGTLLLPPIEKWHLCHELPKISLS
jgi:hypothetical protein